MKDANALPLPVTTKQTLSQQQRRSSSVHTVLDSVRPDWGCRATLKSTDKTTTLSSSSTTERLQPPTQLFHVFPLDPFLRKYRTYHRKSRPCHCSRPLFIQSHVSGNLSTFWQGSCADLGKCSSFPSPPSPYFTKHQSFTSLFTAQICRPKATDSKSKTIFVF